MRFARSRSVIAIAAFSTAAVVLAGCSSSGGERDSADGDWSYTTGLGNTVETDEFPDRVVADVYSTVAMWDYGIRPVGVFGYGFEISGGDVDLDSIERIGTDAEFSLEKLLTIDAQVVIGYGNQEDHTSWTWWEPEFATKVNEVAPFVGVNFGENTTDGLLAEYADLAEALGGDVDSPQIEQDKADYEAAKERVSQAAADNPDLTVLPINGVDPLYLGGPGLQQVAQLRDLGVNITTPPTPEGQDAFIEFSWENIPDLASDIVLVYDPSMFDYDAVPVFASSAAARAGQTLEWDDKRPNTYRSYATWLNSVAEVLESAQKVT